MQQHGKLRIGWLAQTFGVNAVGMVHTYGETHGDDTCVAGHTQITLCDCYQACGTREIDALQPL